MAINQITKSDTEWWLNPNSGGRSLTTAHPFDFWAAGPGTSSGGGAGVPGGGSSGGTSTPPPATGGTPWTGSPGGAGVPGAPPPTAPPPGVDPTWWNSLSTADKINLGLAGATYLGGSKGVAGYGGAIAPPYLTNPTANASSGVAYQTLLNILMSGGRTDPRMMNALLSQVQQNTQGAQMQQQGMAARQGFQNSGVNAAVQAAIGQAGATRQSDIMAREAQMAEERRRQDLNLFMEMIMRPSIDYSAMALGQYNADRDRSSQDRAARDAMLAQIIGAIGRSQG